MSWKNEWALNIFKFFLITCKKSFLTFLSGWFFDEDNYHFRFLVSVIERLWDRPFLWSFGWKWNCKIKRNSKIFMHQTMRCFSFQIVFEKKFCHSSFHFQPWFIRKLKQNVIFNSKVINVLNDIWKGFVV